MDDKCNGCTSVKWPLGWGSGPSIDLPFIQRSKAGAECVKCVCDNCADFDELRSWKSKDKGCSLAAETIRNGPTSGPEKNVCKVGSDYSPDAITHYDCDNKMSESDCKNKGGDTYEGE